MYLLQFMCIPSTSMLPDPNNNPSFYPMKVEILVSEETPYFSDFPSERLGPSLPGYVLFRCYKHKSVVTIPDPKVHTAFYGTELNSVLRSV